MFKKIVMTAMLALVATTALQAEGKHFFEPTQAQYDCCAKEIHAQELRYKQAKKEGNYKVAVQEALFYWTRAWLHFNKAISTAKAGDEASLKQALSMLDQADHDASAAGDNDQAKKVLDLSAKNKATITGKLNKLKQ